MAGMAHILVTGAAGFIGYHLSLALLAGGHTVTGVDNLNDYYDPALKQARLSQLSDHRAFRFFKLDLAQADAVTALFDRHGFDRVVHLAAQAGVRYSIENPLTYVSSNMVGFAHVLEGCRRQQVGHLLYASSSSVYGSNASLPWSTAQPVDHPVSVYAATKKSNELMAHAYAHLYALPCTGLRFFTVYGPWGRPDMAYYKFARAIVAGEPIQVYNRGHMRRDFTYVGDAIGVMLRLIDQPARPDPQWNGLTPDASSSAAPYRLYNVGHHRPVELPQFIELLEHLLERPAIRVDMPMQPGDIEATFADIGDLARDAGFAPSTSLESGLGEFVRWFRHYHRV